jgi:hypothetical protein
MNFGGRVLPMFAPNLKATRENHVQKRIGCMQTQCILNSG